VAKKDGIFDDPTIEISELTAVLKQDRDRLEKMLEMLSEKAKNFGSSEHSQRHATSIIKTLEMRLGECTQTFTKALELRARTMQKQQKKRQAFTGTPVEAPVQDEVALTLGDEMETGGQYVRFFFLDFF
jgi:syntaxin 5